MKRFAAFAFALFALTTPAIAGSPFGIFRSESRSRSNVKSRSQVPARSNPAMMSAEQMEKVFGPSILVRSADASQATNSLGR
ncbi:hypothetical protein CA13_70640 [Planctomycetes bacterium CA13]|uniref:Uncharacterized protein n=1 Tax=Novipirellula herctigrandis TaxID=2527986 RepID=A0A5C5YP14_9BACT|nr:hypothetical protein CA13_70640 [Planctomycetes bacterium CA13]